jgi:PleD family two-component response regulator
MQKSYTALLIDDSITRRNLLASAIRTSGTAIEAATGGFHAISMLEDRSYDFAIVIGNMTDMPMLEIVGLMRSIRNNKTDFPIITAGPELDSSEVMSLIEMGANEVLIWDGDARPILERIRQYT